MALNESVCFTYRDLVHLMRAVSDAKDGPLTSDSANRITAAFRSLACTNPAEAEGKALELTWRYAFYGRINYFREQAMASDSEEALASMTNCCLGGILYFKQLLVQIHHCYPNCSFLNDMQFGMSSIAKQCAIDAVSQFSTSQNPVQDDITSIVQMCLVKMGDLARYLSDVMLPREDGKELQEQARTDAAEYYLKAQKLDASIGLIYNQLGAVLEHRDPATSSVCLGSCMHFAIAATARFPARSGIVNFRRSIGIHRNALQYFLTQHSLLLPATLQHQKWTHILHLVSMCVIPVFGTGVDHVDVDKSKGLWKTMAPVLQAMLIHPHYSECVKSRRPDEDIGLQAATFACICVWYAHEQIKHCTDQVESMGHCTVFSTLAPLLIGMGQVYAQSAALIMDQLGYPTSELETVLTRCVCALLLIVHILTEHFDNQDYVQAYETMRAFIEACESLVVSLAGYNKRGYSCLTNTQAECVVFAGSAAFRSMAAASELVENHMRLCGAMQRMASRLADTDWHEPVHQLGVRLSESVKELLSSEAHSGITRPGTASSPIDTSVDDIDDIVLLPGQLVQRMR